MPELACSPSLARITPTSWCAASLPIAYGLVGRHRVSSCWGLSGASPKIAPEEHQAAIAAAELRGYQRGMAAAEAQARAEAERRTAAAYEQIAGVRHAMGQADRGEFATDAEVKEIFGRPL